MKTLLLSILLAATPIQVNKSESDSSITIHTVKEHSKCTLFIAQKPGQLVAWNVIGDLDKEIVETHEVSKLFLWGKPGKYYGFANVFDTESLTVEVNEILIVITGSSDPDEPDVPDNPDNPNPTVPTDRFGNVGQKARAIILREGIPVGLFSSLYKRVGAALQSGDMQNMMTAPQAYEAITSGTSQILEENPEFKEGWSKLKAEIAPIHNEYIKRNSTRFDMGEFYSALGKGL